MSLLLRGVLEKPFGGFLCLRGFAPLGALAEHSVADYNNYQRQLDVSHRDKLVNYLNQAESRLFPELILGVDLGDDYGVSENEYNNLFEVLNKKPAIGFSRASFGKLTFSVFCKNFTPTSFSRTVHATASVCGFESGENAKIYRIDGNHRLEAVESAAADQAAKDLIVPFCLILFRDKRHYDENAPLVFNAINFRQMPISEEENLKLILLKKRPDGEFLFRQEVLQGMGHHFVLARQALSSLDQKYFPKIWEVIKSKCCCFFKNLFEWLEDSKIISSTQDFDSLKPYLTSIEALLGKVDEQTWSIASLGVLSFYLIGEQTKRKLSSKKRSALKSDAFIAWLKRNRLSDIEGIKDMEGMNMRALGSIYDRIHKLVPKRVFIARWYPASTDPHYEAANCRFAAIKEVVLDLGLELVDMGTRRTGTFPIRNEMFRELSDSDVFIADLTGCRHNVMVEVGYALHRIVQGRTLLYFQETEDFKDPPFDLSDFSYEKITDSSHIKTKVKPRLEKILELSAEGQI